ncbi:MAG: hypothetical protein AB1467_02090 [Candidatus Diapherotrites archaeon]
MNKGKSSGRRRKVESLRAIIRRTAENKINDLRLKPSKTALFITNSTMPRSMKITLLKKLLFERSGLSRGQRKYIHNTIISLKKREP